MSQHETAAQGNAASDELRDAARTAAGNAYRPYSGLGVGAAALAAATDGSGTRIVTGCNVENASYGLTLCAECSLVSDLHRTGGGRLIELVVVSHTGDPLAPCGRCRQLLHEHGGPDLVVHPPRGAGRLREPLPDAFGAGDLT